MARKVIDTFWDRETRNDINENFKELYEDYYGGFVEDVKSEINEFKDLTNETINNMLESSLSMVVKDDFKFGINFRLGTLNVNTGRSLSSTNRIRGALSLPKYDRIILQTKDDVKMRLFFYEGNTYDSYMGNTEYSNLFVLDGLYNNTPYYRVRILLAYTDDRDITNVDELANKLLLSQVLEPVIRGKRIDLDVFKTLYGNYSTINEAFSSGYISAPDGGFYPLGDDSTATSSHISIPSNAGISVVDDSLYELNIFYYDNNGSAYDYKGMSGWVTHDNLNTSFTHFRVSIRYKDSRSSNIDFLKTKLQLRTSNDSSLSKYKLTGSDWSIGSLVPFSSLQPEYVGDLITDTKRLRSKYIKVSSGSIIRFNSRNGSLKYRYLFYESKSINGYNGVYTGYMKDDTVITDDGYIKILLSYDDDRDITDMTELYPYIEVLTDTSIVLEQKENKIEYGFTNLPNSIFETAPLPIVNNQNEGLYVRGMTHEDIYDLYDELLNDHPEIVTKKLLGESNNKPIYQYTFKEIKPWEVQSMNDATAPIVFGNLKPAKVVIVSNIHGTEKMATWNVYNMFEHICNKWENNENISFLRQNVEFIVVPILNPDGMDRTARGNPNGVDLNRNFPVGFYSGGSSRGDAPFSEIESQIIKDVILENLDADYFLDFHNTALSNPIPGGAGNKNMVQVCTDNELIKNIGANTIQNLTPHWRKKYPYLNEAFIDYWKDNQNIYPVGIIVQNIEASMVQYADYLGLKSAIIEQQSLNMFDGNKRYDSFTNEVGFEFCVNMVVNLVKNLK